MNVSPTGSGDISSNDFSGDPIPPFYPANYTCSNVYTLSAVPGPGYVFEYWKVVSSSGSVIYTTSPITVNTTTQSKNVTAYFIDPQNATTLYFPHVTTRSPWQTEIGLINASSSLAVAGTLKAKSNSGLLLEVKEITLPARGRRQITVANEFVNHSNIGYIIFTANTTANVVGYTKFFQSGAYRTAIPAVTEVNTSDIYISHIASNSTFWTGISLVNTNAQARTITLTFNDGRSTSLTINANEHKIFTIAGLFGGQPQTAIKSGVISNASGIIGLELFGSASQLDGLLLTDNTVSTIYYPHVANQQVWWTGIVAYNPSSSACDMTITPYTESGTVLDTSTISIAGKEKYIGLVRDLDLPDQTAWFKIDASRPITGFELFSTLDNRQLAAYAEASGAGARTGVFPKIEKSGWTGIAFVNTESTNATVTLTAYNDSGTAIASQTIALNGYEKVVSIAEQLFAPASISSATYIAFSANRNVVGFQLNGSSDSKMLDSLPALN